MHRYDVITFDCYGTLIDWIGGITTAIEAAACSAGLVIERTAIFPAYLRAEAQVEQLSYRPYREVLAECARRVAAELGWTLPAAQSGLLAESVPQWRPFPDTNPALERLHTAGYRLGIISNVDDDLLAATRRHFRTDFAFLVTAQRVGSYKPAHAHFLEARRRIAAGGAGTRWLHAAQSYYHDVVPACALGIPVAWVNRHHEALAPGAAHPLHEVPDLAHLAAWLAP
ncbi:MAG: HAD hydrolase-like protein [Deltaproteobacteria bacterium]|nr:HAD hydrolase-like protein [Deltaproteobacteria bacterium]